jgi:hypothetical protein
MYQAGSGTMHWYPWCEYVSLLSWDNLSMLLGGYIQQWCALQPEYL